MNARTSALADFEMSAMACRGICGPLISASTLPASAFTVSANDAGPLAPVPLSVQLPTNAAALSSVAGTSAAPDWAATVAVTDDGSGRLKMAEIVGRAERIAPALEELVLGVLPGACELALELADDE